MIVRIAVVPDRAKPLPIFDVTGDGSRRARIATECEWAVVTRIPADDQGGEGYVVYYVDALGRPGDMDECGTLEKALAQVERQTGIAPSHWFAGSYARTDANPFARFDPQVLRDLCRRDRGPAT